MLPICAFTSKIYLIPINKGVSIIPIIFIDSKCPWVRVFLFLLSISVYLPVIVVVISSVVESNLFSKPVSHIIIKIAPVHSFTAAIICIMAASTNWTWFLLLRALIALLNLNSIALSIFSSLFLSAYPSCPFSSQLRFPHPLEDRSSLQHWMSMKLSYFFFHLYIWNGHINRIICTSCSCHDYC